MRQRWYDPDRETQRLAGSESNVCRSRFGGVAFGKHWTSDESYFGWWSIPDRVVLESKSRRGELDMQVRHPEVSVQLTGRVGNAFFIIGRVQSAMRRAGVPKAEIEAYGAEATSGDYDNVIQTTMRWVDVT